MTGWSYAEIDVTVWLTIEAWKKWTWCGFGVGALNSHGNEKTDDDEQFHFHMFQSRREC
jgi:hypothetical protein